MNCQKCSSKMHEFPPRFWCRKCGWNFNSLRFTEGGEDICDASTNFQSTPASIPTLGWRDSREWGPKPRGRESSPADPVGKV